MAILNYIRNIFNREAVSTTPPQTTLPRRGGVSLLNTPASGSMTVATVYRCVNLLANSVSNLPVRYMRNKGGVFVEDVNSRLHYLLTIQPNRAMSAVDFWRLVVINLQLHGNAYVVPVYDGVEISRLALVDPQRVVHDTTNDTYTITDPVAGINDKYLERDILHFKNFTYDGKRGVSTLEFARRATEIAATGDAETLNRFRNGGNIRGIISNDKSVRGYGDYKNEQLDDAAQLINEQIERNAPVIYIPGQANYTQMSMSSTDMQFLETRKFSVRDICRFFGVHPSFVFDDTSNNYKSAEMANVAFLSNTLNPLLRSIENELHRKLIPAALCCKRKFEFDRRSLYACDLDSRVKYQTQTIAAGIYTLNDWRRVENQPEVEGGNTVLVSANLKSLDELNPNNNGEQNNQA